MSYYGYDRHGGSRRLISWATQARSTWDATGQVPERLDHLRAALFYEARCAHWASTPAAEWKLDAYAEALLDAIRSLSGGVVEQDRDDLVMRTHRGINRLLRRT